MKKILISPTYDISPMGLERQSIHSQYVKGIFDVGMLPILAVAALQSIPKMAEEFDGLLLTGGGDIAWKLYSKEKVDGCAIPNHYRDEYELRLFSEFVNRKKPVFGICRGLQIINVALGGTLIGELSDVTREKHSGGVAHTVRTAEKSVLATIIGESYEASSYHHQGLADLGKGLFASATTDGFIVEALEHEWLRIAGVHWHPERSVEKDIYQKMLLAYLA